MSAIGFMRMVVRVLFFRRRIILKFHHAGDLDVGDEDDTGVLVVEWSETLEDGADELFGDGGDDHDEGIVLVESDVTSVESMASFSGDVVDDGVAFYSCTIKEIGSEGLVLTGENDFQFLERVEV